MHKYVYMYQTNVLCTREAEVHESMYPADLYTTPYSVHAVDIQDAGTNSII